MGYIVSCNGMDSSLRWNDSKKNLIKMSILMHPNLRPPQDNDAPWLLAALNHAPTNHALIDLPHPYPEEFIHEFWLDNTQPLLQFVWLERPYSSPRRRGSPATNSNETSEQVEGNTFRVGYIWFSVSNTNNNAEMSFLLHPKHQGNGLGLRQLPHIFTWLTAHMQQHFNTTNITAHVRPHNQAAQNILTACGFKLLETTEYPTANGNTCLQKWVFIY
jgi:RimJ/RimL family protein N-acetyltransferase